MKVIKLKGKTNGLVILINEISKQTYSILFDTRDVLTEFDNPMENLKAWASMEI